MDARSGGEVTRLLGEMRNGASEAGSALLEVVYGELRAIADHLFRHQPDRHTLQPTALVHEACVRLLDADSAGWNDRKHFFAVAARAMRQLLTDHARARRSEKRGAGWNAVTLDAAAAGGEGRGTDELDLVALHDALERLGERSERQRRIVEMRFLVGLTLEEIADVLAVSVTTVKDDWRIARAWLHRELTRGT
ncbi:MAG: sigma-70 family RNA polymerase sigma factor [Planctomycetota bacterium JB042]